MARMTKKQKSYIDRDMLFFNGKVMLYSPEEFSYFQAGINHIIQNKKIMEFNKKFGEKNENK